MSENKKSPIEIIATILSIIVAIVFLSKLIKRDENEEIAEGAKKSRKSIYDKIPPSYEDYRYKDFADTLDTAIMQSATEDEQAVYNVFGKMKNISDVNKTIEAFGTKRQMFTTHYLTLPQAITENFSKGEIKKLNAILSLKNIDYTFE